MAMAAGVSDSPRSRRQDELIPLLPQALLTAVHSRPPTQPHASAGHCALVLPRDHSLLTSLQPWAPLFYSRETSHNTRRRSTLSDGRMRWTSNTAINLTSPPTQDLILPPSTASHPAMSRSSDMSSQGSRAFPIKQMVVLGMAPLQYELTKLSR